MTEKIKQQEITELEKLIKEKKFSEAKNLIKSNSSLDAPIKQYNLGLVSIEEGDYLSARILMENAIEGGFLTKESLQKLDLIKSELGIEEISKDYSTYENLILTYRFSDDFYYGIIGLFILVSGVFLLISKRVMASFSFVLSLSLFFFYTLGIDSQNVFISMEKTEIKLGPSRIFESVNELSAGVKFTIEKVDGNWTYIKYPESHRGWVYKLKARKL